MEKEEAEKRFATLQQSAGQKKSDLPGKDHGTTQETGGFSTGTGFFVTNNGYAITNFHVIEGSHKIRVVGEDNVLIPAKVVATDPQNDVALIKIDGPTVALPFKDSGDLAKGQEIATLGYPLIMLQGQESKATFGRISALSGLHDDQRFIQIDAAIQPGNSGGPLFDDLGNVVGITSSTVNAAATMELTGSLPQNINFALKFDYAIPLLNKIPRSDRSYVGAGSRVRTMADIIQRSEESVVLIVALGE
jgi:S1-C subfamily serine protease